MAARGSAPEGIALRPVSAADCAGAASFLQSGFWGEFKAAFGWKPLYFHADIAGLDAVSSSQVLLAMERRLAPGLSFAYLPHGPSFDPGPADRARLLVAVAAALRPRLSPECAFVRFDPPWTVMDAPASGGAGGAGGTESAGARPESAASYPGSAGQGAASPSFDFAPALRKASADVQPPDTVVLDLRAGEDELLAAMKPKWRYNVRLAEKRGVRVERRGADAIPSFYRLYKATAARDGIALHPEAYYARLFESALSWRGAEGSARPDLGLWIAAHEGEELAAIVTLFMGGTATYLYGASSDAKRELMPAYALQWAAMRAAKEAGCAEYDLYGIPPTDNPQHPMAGLYRFKTGFGGRIAHRAGSWDYPLRPLAYAAYRCAEAARSLWFKGARKRLAALMRRR